MKQPLTLVKLGGSVITDKNTPMSLRRDVLASLADQIQRAITENPEKKIIVSHGTGSFGHFLAEKHRTIEGFVHEDSVLGAAAVQDSVAQLNRHVVNEFISRNVPAVTFAASNALIASNHQAKEDFFQLLEAYITKGFVPVLHGDVIVDVKKGCTVWPTEEILVFAAEKFLVQGYKVDSIVYVTEVPGFLDENKQIISEITAVTWPELQQHLQPTKGTDVTGGMVLKVEKALELAQKGVRSIILSGENNNLHRYFSGEDWVGTIVR